DFPAMRRQMDRIIPAWGAKQTLRQQSTVESADIENALTALIK
ncbi:unnamed protein product, partial [Rotaria sp. Silwood1]